MPDFLSRLVKRTFGLMTVAQPSTGSIFDPALSVKSDYIQNLAPEDEPGSSQHGINIDSSRKTGIIPQYDNMPALNREKSFNKYNMKPPGQIAPGQIEGQDIQGGFTPVSGTPHNIELLKQSDSDFPEPVESTPLQARSGQDNLNLYTQPARLSQDDRLLYKIDSNLLESIEPESLYAESRSDRNTLPSIVKSVPLEEQSDKNEQDSQEHIEPGQKGFRVITENTNILIPMPGQSYDEGQCQSTGTISLKQMESKPSYSVGLQENQNINRSAAPEPESTYEEFSAREPSSKNSGENSSEKKEHFLDSIDGRDSLVKSGQKDFREIRENTNIIMPITGQSHDKEQSQSTGTGTISLKQTDPKRSYPIGLQKNRDVIRNATSETELPYAAFSASKPLGKNSGENSSGQKSSGQKEPFLDNLDSRAGKSLMDNVSDSSLESVSSSGLMGNEITLQNREPVSRKNFNPPGNLNPDSGSSPIIPGGQNLKRVSTQRVNAVPGQMGNMLIEQHVMARRSPPTTPTIKVTIGRIEVRAVESPLAPQPQTPPPPKQYPTLSLDDYLKQSNG